MVITDATYIVLCMCNFVGYTIITTPIIALFYCAVVPRIAFPPMNFTYVVDETNSVTFTCSTTGIPRPEITWIRNEMPFDQRNTRVTLSNHSEQIVSTDGGDIFFVNRSLTLDNTMDADSGTYTCVASNGNAVDLTGMQNFELFVRGNFLLFLSSKIAIDNIHIVISLLVAPTILEPPENLTVVRPQSATFLCNASARPRPQITWWRMGNLLMEQSEMIDISYNIFEESILSTLTIIMANPSHAGGYVCMATNTAGQATAFAELTVHGKCPSLTSHETQATYVI